MSALKIIPLGGLGEIGMNCMVLEYQDEIILVDCGLMFSDLATFGVEFVIPDFTYLRERAEKVKAVIATHGHEDHVGALAFLVKAGIRAPIYASPFTTLMIRERFKEYALEDRVELRTFKLGEKFGFKHFKIQSVSVNHSIVDAAALIIDTPVGKIIHTGDFKMDPTPFLGHEIDLPTFGKAGDDGVLLLMSDSTNVERHTHTISESVIYQKFEQLFAAAQGLTVISMFASNVSRMTQVLTLAEKMGKRVALSGRSMEQNVRLGAEAGYIPNLDHVLINLNDIDRYDRKEVIVLSTGSQGEYRSALIRISNGEHSQVQLQEGDLVLMSSRFIPGNERAIGRMINNLFKQGAEVLYEAVHDIHTSGHATRPELKKMLELTRPRFFLPIHGEYRHLVHHAKLARETGVAEENVIVATNGAILELTENTFELVEQMEEEPRVLLESRDGSEMSKLVLKDRRQIGEKGIVFALMVRNRETQRIMSGPEIITKGLSHEDREAFLIEEAKRLCMRKLVRYDDDLRKNGHPQFDLEEEIRVELRRFFMANIGKKPVVLPMILDM